MKTILILITAIILYSCTNAKSNSQIIEKYESKKEISNNVTGKWISVNDHIVKDIIISNVDSETYNFKITFKDGGIKNELIKLNYKAEYHTNNRFGEYYKLNGSSLGIYDNQGLLAYYKR